MRLILAGIIMGAMTLGSSTVGTQGASSTKFAAVKLVDVKSATPEQTVNLLVEPEGISIVDPIGNKPIKKFAYEGLDVTHTFASAPPAGDIPLYHGKDPRNWITLKSGTDMATVGVSQHVLNRLKKAFGEHKVTITDSK
jgi:hypothetical protein